MLRLKQSLVLAAVLMAATATSGLGQSGDRPPSNDIVPSQPPPASEAQPRPEQAPLPRIPGVTVPYPTDPENPHGGGGCRYQPRTLELIV